MEGCLALHVEGEGDVGVEVCVGGGACGIVRLVKAGAMQSDALGEALAEAGLVPLLRLDECAEELWGQAVAQHRLHEEAHGADVNPR